MTACRNVRRWFRNTRAVQLRNVDRFDRLRFPMAVEAPWGGGWPPSLDTARLWVNDAVGFEAFADESRTDLPTVLVIETSNDVFMATNHLVVDGEILSSVIEYNPENIARDLHNHFAPWSRRRVMHRAWCHELGHVLGFRHVDQSTPVADEDEENFMYWRVHPGAPRFSAGQLAYTNGERDE